MFQPLQTLRPVDFKNSLVDFHQAFIRQRRLLLASRDGTGLLNDQTAIHCFLPQAYRSISCTDFIQFATYDAIMVFAISRLS